MTRLSAIVIGGGVMGLATGCALAELDVDVTVLERFVVGHEWASSHGLTRGIRHEYGSAAIYTRMVARSLVLWEELARETGRHLYTATGMLKLGRTDDRSTLAAYETMRAEGLPVELLSHEECHRRFPQFTPDAYSAITYNPIGGMLHASECLSALADRLRAHQGAIRDGSHVTHVAATAQGGTVTLADGTSLQADRVIVTAGPWVQDILPELQLPIRATRQQVCYLKGLAPEQFGVGVFPSFLAMQYGFPLQGHGWFKVASHIVGEEVDPNVPYQPDMEEVAGLRDFLRRVIPAAADAELALVDRCMYDMSPDEDFILDRHPDGAGVVIGTGFSGHGFKFGILIGRLLAALALDQQPEFPLDRFRLSRFNDRQLPA